MSSTAHRFSRIALAIACLAPAVHAQALHVLVEPPFPGVGDEIRIRLVSGAPFEGQELTPAEPRGGSLQRLWRSGRESLKTVPPTFYPSEAGVQVIAFLPHRAAGTDHDWASFGKALLVVGDAAAGDGIWRSELGQRLEIVPRTDPAALLEQGGMFEVQILLDREPLVGATVAATAESAPAESYRRAMTNTLGQVRFDLDRPGRWLIHLAHKQFERGPETGWIVLQSSLALAVGPRR